MLKQVLATSVKQQVRVLGDRDENWVFEVDLHFSKKSSKFESMCTGLSVASSRRYSRESDPFA